MVTENKHYLILDYYSKGDLFKYIEESGPFSERQAKYVFKKIYKVFKLCMELEFAIEI